jgi:hypothetical protein
MVEVAAGKCFLNIAMSLNFQFSDRGFYRNTTKIVGFAVFRGIPERSEIMRKTVRWAAMGS